MDGQEIEDQGADEDEWVAQSLLLAWL